MSWNSGSLPVLDGQQHLYWSTRAASLVLDVPVRMVREMIRAGTVLPVGKRWEPGFGTRHVPVYEASVLLRLWESAEAGASRVTFLSL